MAQGKRTYEEIENVLDNPIEEDDIPVEYDDEWKEKEIESEEVLEELTLRQERFCQLYALDTRFMWNGVSAYLEVYDIDTSKKWWYKTACAAASRLLSNVKVYTRINTLLEEEWLNDEFADKQLLFVMSQQASIWAKLDAIKEYNKLKKRITEKVEHSWNIKLENFSWLSERELEEARNSLL